MRWRRRVVSKAFKAWQIFPQLPDINTTKYKEFRKSCLKMKITNDVTVSSYFENFLILQGWGTIEHVSSFSTDIFDPIFISFRERDRSSRTFPQREKHDRFFDVGITGRVEREKKVVEPRIKGTMRLRTRVKYVSICIYIIHTLLYIHAIHIYTYVTVAINI